MYTFGFNTAHNKLVSSVDLTLLNGIFGTDLRIYVRGGAKPEDVLTFEDPITREVNTLTNLGNGVGDYGPIDPGVGPTFDLSKSVNFNGTDQGLGITNLTEYTNQNVGTFYFKLKDNKASGNTNIMMDIYTLNGFRRFVLYYDPNDKLTLNVKDFSNSVKTFPVTVNRGTEEFIVLKSNGTINVAKQGVINLGTPTANDGKWINDIGETPEISTIGRASVSPFSWHAWGNYAMAYVNRFTTDQEDLDTQQIFESI